MGISHEVIQTVEGFKLLRFPFTIDGF